MILFHKSVPTEFKADMQKRRIEGYASTFGNVDHGGDVVLPGAYTKTLAEDMPAGRIKVKRNHQIAIGKPVHAEQDQKGLLTVSQISDTPLGNETLTLVQDGVIDSMSIGYRAEEKAYGTRDGKKVRELKTLRLSEWSFLDEPPMNEDARVTGMKSLTDVSEALDDALRTIAALREFKDFASLDREILERIDTLAADVAELKARATPQDDSLAAVAATLSDLTTLLTARRS